MSRLIRMRLRALAVALVTGLAVFAAGCGGGSNGASSAAGADDRASLGAALHLRQHRLRGRPDQDVQDAARQVSRERRPAPDGARRARAGGCRLRAGREARPRPGARHRAPRSGAGRRSSQSRGSRPAPAGRPAKLDALLEKDTDGTPTVKEEVDGWTVLAESQASIDRFKQMRSRAARSPRAAGSPTRWRASPKTHSPVPM